jgi:hypothetical protein
MFGTFLRGRARAIHERPPGRGRGIGVFYEGSTSVVDGTSPSASPYSFEIQLKPFADTARIAGFCSEHHL